MYEKNEEHHHDGRADKGDDQPSGDKEKQPRSTGAPGGSPGFSRWWWAIIGPALAAAILVPLGGPMVRGIGDVLDGGRDFLRSPDGREADTLKEDLQERDYWVGDPKLLDGSFSFLRHHNDDDWTKVEGASPVYLTVEDLVREAPDYEGEPVLLVAHVDDMVVRQAGGLLSDHRYSATEANVSGVDGSVAAIVGLDGSDVVGDPVTAGSEVVFRGVPTAVGRIRFPNGAVISSVHFTALDAATDISFDVSDPSIRAEIRRIRRAIAAARQR
jgi:hypothetical protein